MIITKIKEGQLEVPIIPKEKIIKRGLYTLVYKDKIIKVGCFGEGVNSTNKTRFTNYRSKGKNITPGNGSYKTMKILNESIKVGDQVKVIFIQLPEDVYMDGYWWKIDLYKEEEKLKFQHKNTLWLS